MNGRWIIEASVANKYVKYGGSACWTADGMEKDKNMLKKDLINAVTEDMEGYLKKDISQVVDIILDSIVDALAEGRRVEIRGFGSFSVRQRKARSTKNPRTGKIMDIPPRKNLHFTMSKSLKEALVRGGQ